MTLAFPATLRPGVSVVMVTYGGWEWVEKSLQAILANTESCYEIIIVDNASPDGLGDRLERELSNARIVRNRVNRGFGCANNQGASLAVGEVLAFVNSDAFVHPGWLAPLLERLDAEPSVAAVAPRLLNTDGSLQEAGSVVFRSGHTQFVGFGDDPGRSEYGFPRRVDYASAACLLIRRRDFFEVGGFDAVYAPGYFEDVDLCLALKSRGRKIVYEPRSTVTHVRGASWGSETGIVHWTRNAPVFAQRWARLLSTRPAFASAEGPPRRRIAARDAGAPFRVLIAADQTVESPDPLRVRRSSWLATELAALYPDARVTLLIADPATSSSAGEGLLERGIEVVGDADWRSWLFERHFHYDVVVLAGEEAIRHFEVFVSTQPQAFLVADAGAFSEGIPRSGRSLRRRKTSRIRDLEALTAADVALFSSSADVTWASSVRSAESCFLVPALFARAGTPPGFWSRENLLFVGSGESGGSADENALAYLVERVLPLVQTGDPRLEFTAEAPVSAELRRRLERDDVHLLAPGGLTSESFDRARLLIAPFPRRPPVSDFLLHAAVLGLPFVASPGAAAGLPFEDLPSDALAGGAREFADRVLALHRDEVRWARLQRALRKKALRSLDAASVREALVRAFAKVGLAPPGPGVLIAAGPRAPDRRR